VVSHASKPFCLPPVFFVTLQVTKMKMISPSNREVDVGKTLSETEYIGMCR
jgi:geranylgeranyl reductase